jgi:hypothetical protein
VHDQVRGYVASTELALAGHLGEHLITSGDQRGSEGIREIERSTHNGRRYGAQLISKRIDDVTTSE